MAKGGAVRVLKWSAAGLALLLLALALLPFLYPAERLRGDVEAALTAALEQPVKLERLAWGLLPVPHLTVTGFSAGEAAELQVARAELELALRPLLDGTVRITRLRLDTVVLPVRLVAALGGRKHEGSGGGVRVRLDEVAAEALTLELPDGTRLGPYALTAELAPRGDLEGLRLTEGAALTLEAEPAGEGAYTLHLTAHDWRLPLPAAPLRFARLTGTLELTRSALAWPDLSGEAYGGRLAGGLRLDWGNGWRLEGRLSPSGVQLEPLLADLGRNNVAGRLGGRFAFRSRADSASRLAKALRVEGDFRIEDGVLRKADLERASQTFTAEGITGGQTRFDALSGHLLLQGRDLRLTDLAITSSALEATGDLRVDPRRNLSGDVEVGLRKVTAIAAMPLRVSGTVDEPHLRIPDEALAGAAAGTAVLGPGVGTAVGIKAGKYLKGIGEGVGRLFDGGKE